MSLKMEIHRLLRFDLVTKGLFEVLHGRSEQPCFGHDRVYLSWMLHIIPTPEYDDPLFAAGHACACALQSELSQNCGLAAAHNLSNRKVVVTIVFPDVGKSQPQKAVGEKYPV